MQPGILAALVLAVLPAGCESSGAYGPVLGEVLTRPGGALATAEIDAGLR